MFKVRMKNNPSIIYEVLWVFERDGIVGFLTYHPTGDFVVLRVSDCVLVKEDKNAD